MAGASFALYAAGRALGTVELSMLAAAGVVVLAVGMAVVFLGRPHVESRRVLRPHRLHAGTPAHAEIELRNTGTRRTGVLSVTDRFTDRREARFAVAPLRPGELARGAYRVPTTRRGVFEMGPLRVGVTDPLGLVRRVVHDDPSEPVTVYPHIDLVSALPLTVERDLVGGAVTDFSRARAGTEFHSLREYQVGDDLRRVHWRSTARTGHLMIREHDVPWQTRATLVLDDREAQHSAAGFERAVEAVASVATALHQQRAIVRLVTTGGVDTGFGSGHDHYEAIMERLAVAERWPTDRFDDVAARLHRHGGTGALIAFLGPGRTHADATGDLMKLATLGRRFGFVAAVRFGGTSAEVATPAPTVVTIDVPDRDHFAAAWNEAMIVRFGVRVR